jgi:two-component system nitrogen regulation sensor histidine kinase NtrY
MKKTSRSASRKFSFRFFQWSRRVGLMNKLAIALVFGVAISGFATYAVLTKTEAYQPSPIQIYFLLLINLILALPLIALVMRLLVRLWTARRSGTAGSKLHGRMVTLFGIVAITPTILTAAFTIMFFEIGLQAWFSDRVRTVLENATSVAEAYIEEHQKVIKADILGMANDLNGESLMLGNNEALMEQAISLQARMLSLSEAIIFDGSGRAVARANSTLNFGGDPFPQDALKRAADGRPLILASENDDRVRALIKLDRYFDLYLYISRYVDPRALALVYQTRTATTQYKKMESRLTEFKTLFNLTFIAIALAILLAAMWTGLRLANRLVKPIADLVEAAEKVRLGDLSVHVPVALAYDELGTLARAFNRMTQQLKNQRDELVLTNAQLDDRRRFTEAVLSGVTAGVLGLKTDGRINLPNRSAAILLEIPESELMGKKLVDVMPEVEPLLQRVERNEVTLAQDQVSIRRGERTINFLVRITAEIFDGHTDGYVVTFDDITEQVAAQRTAAWADVARRIAHEIKNPLTPIQLAAERLKRKYGKEINGDPAVFNQCTDTIIRQVGDLRRIVDEFSSFARMPTPIFSQQDLTDVVRHAVFMQEVAHPAIRFELKTPDTPCLLVCDAQLLTQALTNLLKNATESINARLEDKKSSKGEGHITAEVITDAHETEIRIIDNGRGLPEEIKHRLTEPYVTTRAKGTGLGLAIVKKIMEDHGGVVNLQNNEDGGATVSLIFNHHILDEKAGLNPSHKVKQLQTRGEGQATTVEAKITHGT